MFVNKRAVLNYSGRRGVICWDEIREKKSREDHDSIMFNNLGLNICSFNDLMRLDF